VLDNFTLQTFCSGTTSSKPTVQQHSSEVLSRKRKTPRKGAYVSLKPAIEPIYTRMLSNRLQLFSQEILWRTVLVDKMCDWEDFHFSCGHHSSRLLSYCHFARTDPYHQCFGVKVLKHTWVQNVVCQSCADARREAPHRGARNGR
jgi:hypothetical protein